MERHYQQGENHLWDISLNKFKQLRAQCAKCREASALYEIILKTLIFITLIATAISFFSIFTVYLNLNYTCRRVVREIEIAGQVTGSTTTLFNQLKSQTNIGTAATMDVINVTYFSAADKKIQLRETFSVRCRTSYTVEIFTPAFGTPVAVHIPMTVVLTGLSEKYWKP